VQSELWKVELLALPKAQLLEVELDVTRARATEEALVSMWARMWETLLEVGWAAMRSVLKTAATWVVE
jgi:hypothetical protein